MQLEQLLTSQVQHIVKSLYGIDADERMIQLQKTRPEFEGDITLVVFPFVKAARKAPAQVADEIGQHLVAESGVIERYNAVQGFLNLSVSSRFWIDQLSAIAGDEAYGQLPQRNDGGVFLPEYQ